MWDLIVSVPDHCLSFYFSRHNSRSESSLGHMMVFSFTNPSEFQLSFFHLSVDV